MTLPRPYLSASQMALVERSEKEYVKKYFENKKFTNPGIDFGKTVAIRVQEKTRSGILAILPTKGYIEEYEFDVKSPETFGINLYGSMDMVNRGKDEIIEIKTGAEWSQEMVDKSTQMQFYSFVYWIMFKKVPTVKLYWFGTHKIENYGKIIVDFNGESKIIQRRKDTIKDYIQFSIRIKNAWEKINKLTRKYGIFR